MPETSICGLTGETRVGPSPDPDPDPDPNLPPDSVRLPIHNDDAVATWLENNLNVVYERDDSAKETTNPKSNNPNPKGSRSSSHRYSTGGGGGGGTNLKADGPIIGLPARIRHVNCSASRRPPPPNTNSRIFPKKKKSVPESEPTSPKVSCFGKVLSDRERVNKKDPKTGCWANLAACFAACVGGGQRKRLRPKEVVVTADAAEVKPRKSNYGKLPAAAVGPTEEPAPALTPVPGLGGMVRFASGRRSASWASECEFEIDRQVVLARRSIGALHEGFRETE